MAHGQARGRNVQHEGNRKSWETKRQALNGSRPIVRTKGENGRQKKRPETDSCWIIKSREVLHGVGADGVGVKFPIFAVNCCCLPLSFRRSREKRRKRGKMHRKREKCVKKGKITPTPSTPTPLRISQERGVPHCQRATVRSGHVIRIQEGLETSRIRINARQHYVWKRFPRGTPLHGTPLSIMPAAQNVRK